MTTLSPHTLKRIQRSRRHPRPTQFDYLHLRYLVNDLAAALRSIMPAPREVLDLYCGARPYDDLLPADAHRVGLDVDASYGVADVVSSAFLPFDDASFDLVFCTQAFHYVQDPVQGVREIRRVLRPGGTVVISVPLVWEYDRRTLEHRFTGPELVALFEGWQDVKLVESGGLAVCWTTLTGCGLRSVEERAFALPRPIRLPIRAAFRPVYVLLNAVGVLFDRAERTRSRGPYTLPMNLQLTARRAPDG